MSSLRSRDETEFDAEFFEERGFGRRMGFGKRPALVIVDFQMAFTDPGQPLGAECGELIAQTLRVLTAARDAEIPVFYTAVRFDEPDVRDAGVWRHKQAGMHTLQAGTRLVEIDSRFDMRRDEVIIWKKYASGFFGTDFATRLVVRGVDSVIVTGITTSGCVRATAIDAVGHGFRTAVVREAVGDRSEAAHRQSLFDLDQKYCDVVSVSDVVHYFSAFRTTDQALV